MMPDGASVALLCSMAEASRRRVAVEVPWHTLLKIIAAVALVWVWLQLWPLVLLLVVAVLLAVTLDPVVGLLERRGLPRWGASTLVGFVVLALAAGFLYMTWSSLTAQAHLLMQRFTEIEQSA